MLGLGGRSKDLARGAASEPTLRACLIVWNS